MGDRQLDHRVSGPRHQAKKKKRTWPTPTWLRHQAKIKQTTWPTPTWLRCQAKKKMKTWPTLSCARLINLVICTCADTKHTQKKRKYLARTNQAQLPSKIKGEHLAHSDLAQIPSKKKIAPGPNSYQATKFEVSQLTVEKV